MQGVQRGGGGGEVSSSSSSCTASQGGIHLLCSVVLIYRSFKNGNNLTRLSFPSVGTFPKMVPHENVSLSSFISVFLSTLSQMYQSMICISHSLTFKYIIV